MKNKFQNNDGSLTAYAFACGYIESSLPNWADFPDSSFVELFLDGVWHVKAYKTAGERICWECFDTLTQARKFFKATKKALAI